MLNAVFRALSEMETGENNRKYAFMQKMKMLGKLYTVGSCYSPD